MRNRDQSQSNEMLRQALQVMQEKNLTLEKNLSAETRVKLDLFSALGEARRQLEIKDSELYFIWLNSLNRFLTIIIINRLLAQQGPTARRFGSKDCSIVSSHASGWIKSLTLNELVSYAIKSLFALGSSTASAAPSTSTTAAAANATTTATAATATTTATTTI